MSALHAHPHDHAHAHDHGHGHGHSHAPGQFDRAFAIGIALNLGYVAVEAGFGLAIGSLALVADAGHNLSDVLGLIIAWGASALARRRPSARFTYGLRSSSILAALFNAVLLLVAVGAIVVEAVRRLVEPAPVAAGVVIAVAAAGIIVNAATAMMFAAGRKGDLNIRGAYLHMAADAAVSLGVVVAALVMMVTGWQWLDPLVSLVIAAVIVAGTWGLLRDSVVMALHAVPPGLDLAAVEAALAAHPGVARVHDLHVWSMSTTETALTAHLQMPGGHPGDGFLTDTAAMLASRFGIGHATLQIETDGSNCAQARADAV